jgi:hypothetical protein
MWSFWQAIALSVVVSTFGPLVRAQDLHIKVLDGRNGHPAAKECLNVSIGNWHGADVVAKTGKDGIAVLHLVNDKSEAEAACPGWPAQASRPADAETIAIVSGSSVTCQTYGKAPPGPAGRADLKQVVPTYSITKILKSGVAAANTCGKVRVPAQPGELVLFVRPLTWWEKWKL